MLGKLGAIEGPKMRFPQGEGVGGSSSFGVPDASTDGLLGAGRSGISLFTLPLCAS